MNIKETYKKLMLPSEYVADLQKLLDVKPQTIEEYISKNYIPEKHKNFVVDFTNKWIEWENKCKEIKVEFLKV